MTEPDHPPKSLRRWRLALGRFADQALGGVGSGDDARMDRALDHVYRHAYLQRGHRLGIARRSKGSRLGGSEKSTLTQPEWLREMRALFPRSVYRIIQGHAIARFGMTDLLENPKAVQDIDPDADLLAALLRFKGRADPGIAAKIRDVAAWVVADLMKRLRLEMDRALSGARRPGTTARQAYGRDIAWNATIRANLKTYDLDRRVLIAERLRFIGRVRRHLPWTVILCVDQSGSMLTAIIHSTVMAAILSSLPSIRIKLVVFDTAIVDLTDQVGDPVSVLMAVQLGGGTDIGKALAYCEDRYVTRPDRTILVLVSDFCEGAAPHTLLATVKRLAGAGVTLLGLAALEGSGAPQHDEAMAQLLATAGMHVAALTPEHFARWIAERIR